MRQPVGFGGNNQFSDSESPNYRKISKGVPGSRFSIKFFVRINSDILE